jgi:hypothetical protein
MIYAFPRPYEYLLGPDDEKKDKEKEDSGKPNKKTDIIFHMQLLFAKMQFANVSSVSTSGLTTSFGWDK